MRERQKERASTRERERERVKETKWGESERKKEKEREPPVRRNGTERNGSESNNARVSEWETLVCGEWVQSAAQTEVSFLDVGLVSSILSIVSR